MQRSLILTKDGSHTVAVPDMNVTYHSVHGAIQESMHVFIDAGWNEIMKQRESGKGLSVLEMGFGTGLNALLTLIEAERTKQPVHYTAIELYPLGMQEVAGLNYCEQLRSPQFCGDRPQQCSGYKPQQYCWGKPELQSVFEQLHLSEWERIEHISEYFILEKRKINLVDFVSQHMYELVYFDAFAPTAQPELWTKEVFEKLYSMMQTNGILVTYCSKGDVRRAMGAAGFGVEKIPGPMGKREMVRARRE